MLDDARVTPCRDLVRLPAPRRVQPGDDGPLRRPQTRAEASKHVSFPLPASARDVYFLNHAGGSQEFAEFVRFNVEPDEAEATVGALPAGRPPCAATYAPEVERPFQPMPWWTPDAIAHGHHRTAGQPPIYLWTDTDNHRIFMFRSD